jgi:tRNA(His) 5'-end guanylyltransferase
VNFDDLDAKMRRYETLNERSFFAETDLVIRLDGRSFTALTRRLGFQKPFDAEFNRLMNEVTQYLMKESHVKFLYGYHQSDEISLLLSRQDNSFERKERKLLSLLASAAGAKFSLEAGTIGTFDARISALPRNDLVVDYFRWRQEDALRNALTGYAFWKLREQGLSGARAQSRLDGLTKAAKNELLFTECGVNFNDVTAWHKRGTGLWFETVTKSAFNKHFQQEVEVTRRALRNETKLPYGDEYGQFINKLLISEDVVNDRNGKPGTDSRRIA